jgi:hypothetical protein
MKFLSAENAEQIMGLFLRYMRERRGISQLPPMSEECRQVMVAVAQEVRSGALQGDLETLNRQVIGRLIPLCLQKIMPEPAALPASQALHASPPLPPSPPPQALQASQALPHSPLPEPMELTPEKSALEKDQQFLEELKRLEMSRRLPLIGNDGSAPAASAPPASAMDLLLPKVAPAQIPSHIATVFMPAPAKRGQELLIQSHQRNWVQYPHRNGFSWGGPVPPGGELRIEKVFLPEYDASRLHSPYLVLHLEGAGGQTAQVYLYASQGNIQGTGWRIYEPMASTLGYIKTLACPWKVRLLLASGKPVEMGTDGESVEVNASGVVSTKAERSPGDQWWLFGTNGSIYPWNLTDDIPVSPGFQGVVLNYSRQWWVVLSVL